MSLWLIIVCYSYSCCPLYYMLIKYYMRNMNGPDTLKRISLSFITRALSIGRDGHTALIGIHGLHVTFSYVCMYIERIHSHSHS